MEYMRQAEFKEIETRAAIATDGPWTTKPEKNDEGLSTTPAIAFVARGQGVYSKSGGSVYPANDQNFIAHAREDIPKLLAELKDLKARLCACCLREVTPAGKKFLDEHA